MNVNDLNNLSMTDAQSTLGDLNAARAWIDKMAAARPFASIGEMKITAENIWLTMTEQDHLQAFEAHPMIGDVSSLRAKYASTKAMASGEQSGASGADEIILAELSELNHTYRNKFGFIFIVFATGKSAGEMLALLRARIGNTRSQEIENAAAEQIKITLLRIDKLFAVA